MTDSRTPSNPTSSESPDGASLEDLAQQMGDLARALQAEDDEEAILAHLVKSAIDLVPGADEASISVVTGRKTVRSHAPSGDLPKEVDALQAVTGQGPCLDAVFEHRTVHVPDMASEDRWPRFASGAAKLGAASMLSFQLFVAGDNLGALNLYARSPNAFDTESDEIGLLIAAHAAVAFAEGRKMGQMHDALASRDLIGQAKGIQRETGQPGCPPPQARRVGQTVTTAHPGPNGTHSSISLLAISSATP